MNKEEVLQELRNSIESGEVSRQEVLSTIGMSSGENNSASQVVEVSNMQEPAYKFMRLSINEVLYILGTIIVIVGILIFVGQIWGDLNSFTRILITLGLGLLMAGVGSALWRDDSSEKLGSIFHFLGGVMVPIGVMVLLSEYSTGDGTMVAGFSYAFVALFYLVLSRVYKRELLTIFSIMNFTFSVYFFTNDLVNQLVGSYLNYDIYYATVTLLLGVFYLFLSYLFKFNWNEKLTGILNFFGGAFILGSSMWFVWEEFDAVLPKLLYFFLLIGFFFFSVYAKSKSLLALTTIFLLIYISLITSDYFADSLGWPVSLVILGFAFIGMGYTSISISKKYIST